MKENAYEICNEEKESANESSEIKANVAYQESISSPVVKSEHRIDHTSCMFVKAQIGNKTTVSYRYWVSCLCLEKEYS